jgi:phage head maturation protease
MEKRILGAHELRASKHDGKMKVSGYAARYNVLSHPMPIPGGKGTFRERIAKRAFDRILGTGACQRL